MKSLLKFLNIILFLSLCSCGNVDTEYTIAQAEGAIVNGNVELALSNCDILSDSLIHLTSPQMCRVAIIYAKASEITDNQDYMAIAAQYFERASEIDNNTDSLDVYIGSLDLEDQSVVRVIREVSHALNNDHDYPEATSDEDDLQMED